MIAKIRKTNVFEKNLDSLEVVLKDAVSNLQSVRELIKKVKDEEELTEEQYGRLLKLIDVNSDATAVSPMLLRELFWLNEE